MEFWNDAATERSWQALKSMGKKFSFILIGGWACYILTKTMKSKDIDIIVDFETLGRIRQEFPVNKTGFLKKYEARIGDASVDVYILHYSRFILPAEEIERSAIDVGGFRVLSPEVMVLLKQQAEMERKDSAKGQKDRVDILNLLINSGFDAKEYMRLTEVHGLGSYRGRLLQIIREARKEFAYLGITDPGKAKRIRKSLEAKLKA